MRLTPSPILPPLPQVEFAALREQIAENGVETPLLVTAEGVIIDGHERFRACQEIGLRKYPIRVLGNMTEGERVEKAIRLNVHRRHLTRAERQRLLEDLIRASPVKSSREIADTCKVSQSTAARAKARMLSTESNDSVEIVGRNGKHYTYKPAYSAETARQADEAGRLMRELGEEAPAGGVSLRTLRHLAFRQRARAEAAGPAAQLPPEVLIERCDFRQLEKKVGDMTGRVDLLLLDPPWKAIYFDLLAPLGEMARRLLKPGGILACYCGQGALPAFMEAFGNHLDYRWLLTCRNTTILSPTRVGGNIKTMYRPVLLYSKGALRCPKTVDDMIAVAQQDDHYLHPENWQQPEEEAVYFVQKLTRPGSLVCDLTCGSGTVAAAVAKIGQGRKFIGCDIDPACVRIARRRVAEALSTAHATA